MSRDRHSSPDTTDERQPLLYPPAIRGSAEPVLTDSEENLIENRMGLRSWLQQIDVLVYLLVMVFAISSWIDINGVWVELPLLVETLPEGWNLPSYLVIIIQIANVGPIAFTLASKFMPNRVKEWPVVYLIITIGAISCLLMSVFWDRTTVIGGNEHSTPLLSLTAFLSIVDCTSSVVFLPYMAMFKPQYLTAFYIGEGLSGLIPGVVGLIQGVGSDPACVNKSIIIFNETTGENYTVWEIVPVYKPSLFSVDVFFIILFFLLCLSAVAFTCLNFVPYCQKEKVFEMSQVKPDKIIKYRTGDSSKEAYSYSHEGTINDLSSGQKIIHISMMEEEEEQNDNQKNLGFWHYAFLLGIIAWVNGLTNGVLPSTQSYSSLPYSNMVYTLSVRLSTLANPLACFVALFISTKSFIAVTILTFLGSVLSAYQLYLAALSPTPILQNQVSGEVLCVLTAILLTGIFSYIKVTVASIFQQDGKKALLWCGVFTQVGSCVGAIIIFILVNVVKVFTASYADPCPSS